MTMARRQHTSFCSVCEHPSTLSPCPLCESIIVSKTNNRWTCEIPDDTHFEALQLIGGGSRTAKQRWKCLMQNVSDSEDVGWAQLPDQSLDPVLVSPCDGDDMAGIIERISDGVRLNRKQRVQLHRGFHLFDGTHVSFVADRMYLNGRPTIASVPMVSILNLLSSKKHRLGWDLSKLLIAIGTMTTGAIDTLQIRRVPRRLIGPNRIRDSLDKPTASAMLSWVEWMAEEQLEAPKHSAMNPLGAWSRDVRQRLSTPIGTKFENHLKEAFTHHPTGLEELTIYPWTRRWLAYTRYQRFNTNRTWPFEIVGGKLKFVVRAKNNASRKTSIPEEPGVWAFLISLAFSPHRSSGSDLLYALQFNWTDSKQETHQISAPLRRSIQFLREVIDSNSDRVFVHEERMLVIGRLGHFYEVKVGRGAHGAPFIIRAIDSLGPRSTTALCIHHGTFHSTVPLGDTIVSVILSLVDDVKTSGKIGSLREHIALRPPLGFLSPLNDKHIRFLRDSAVQEFKQITANHSDAIRWLPRDQPTEAGGRNQNMMHLFHRNVAFNRRRRWHQGGNAPNRKNRCDVLVEHAVAADSAMPHPQFIELWHESLKDGSAEEIFEPHHYFHHFGHDRNNWAQLHLQRQHHITLVEDLPVGDIRNGERRYCEIFPRIWDALLQHPIGSTFRLAVLDGGDVTFEHCHLAMTVRNQQERRILRRFATLLGFVEQGTHDQSIVFIRRDHAKQTARRDLALHLDRAQSTLGNPNSSPWHWHFGEVVQTPHHITEFRWGLQQDLRDSNRRLQRPN